MVLLPEALLLLALDDEKGTVFPAAFLALDHALRGALLAELRLEGVVQTKKGGAIRRAPTAPSIGGDPLLDRAWQVVSALPNPGNVNDWLAAFERSFQGIRNDILASLDARGVLAPTDTDRGGVLPGSTAHLLKDRGVALEVTQMIRQAAAADPVPARGGTLVALVDSVHLLDRLFPKDERAAARRVAAFVAERDSIVQGVSDLVRRTEGDF